jgi:5-(aminomethyl)-3-furanmethanol phosphate kinase
MQMIVVKVGGSLYDWPGLGPALRAFVAALDPSPVLLVPGGGDFADAVRKLHAVHGLTEEQSHWLALESLWPTARLVCTLAQTGECLLPYPPIPSGERVAVLDPHCFCNLSGPDLPHTWEVTTDSIAAWAAVVWKAERLVLLKSIDVPPGTPWDEAAARGWVDPYFTRALAGYAGTVEAVNLRTWGGNTLASDRQ